MLPHGEYMILHAEACRGDFEENIMVRVLLLIVGIGILLCIIITAIYDVKQVLETIVFISFTGFVSSIFSNFFTGRIDIIGLLFTIIGLAACITILVWVLKQKQRNLWWVLIIFVPLGWLVISFLGNRSKVLDIVDGKVITRHRE